MKTGIELIAEERQRQIEKEGYSSEHDDKHTNSELSEAGISYAIAGGGIVRGSTPEVAREVLLDACLNGLAWEYPFEPESFKVSPDPIVNFAKAGALIAAEIDRLQRKGLLSGNGD